LLRRNVDNILTRFGATINDLQSSKESGMNMGYSSESPLDQSGWKPIIDQNITRFGTMIIVSILVGILSPLYRYNIRIASYHDARADALEFLKTNLRTNGYLRLATGLTPTLDFAKEPLTPMEQVVEIAKLILEKQKHE